MHRSLFLILFKYNFFCTLCLLFVETGGCLIRGGLQCRHTFRVYLSYCNGIIYSNTEIVRQIPQVFFFKFSTASVSSEAHESDVFVVRRLDAQSAPKPDEET